MTYINHTTVGRRSLGTALLSGALLATAACDTDEIISASDPDRVRIEAISDSTALPAVYGAAIADFQLAYSGGNAEGQILQSGLLGDEYYSSGTFPTRIEVDRRDILDRNATNQDVFRRLGRARRTAEVGADGFGQFLPRDVRRSEIFSLAAFTYVFFGENYCSGVPVSDVVEGEFVFGQPLPTDSLQRRALARFDSALAVATAADTTTATLRTARIRNQNLARIGRGRALLNLGQFAQAAAAVTGVPTTFRYDIEHSGNTSRQNNGQWNFSNNQGRWSVANKQGGNGLPYQDAFNTDRDTRVPSAILGGALRRGQATTALRVTQQKYPELSSPVPLATGIEARLIEAEAALRAGNITSFLEIHNALRANTGLYACPTAAIGCTNRTTALPPLTVADAATPEAAQNTHFRERAYWLFETSHRLGDMRRLITQYGRGAETVFPTGAFTRPSSAATSTPLLLNPGTYGTDVSLPVPIDEQNNPNFTGCDNTAAGEQKIAATP